VRETCAAEVKEKLPDVGSNQKVHELESLLDKLTSDRDGLKSENNSLKKKIRSLQVDFEKMSRRGPS